MKVSTQSVDRDSVKILFYIFLLVLVQTPTFATNQGNIIQVTRKLRMSYMEPLPPKEFFVDLGERDGVKIGDIVEVYRMIPVINSMSGGPWHLLKVALGDMRLVFVGESTSIGRVEVEREPSSLPAIEYHAFMLGDQVQVKTGLPFH